IAGNWGILHFYLKVLLLLSAFCALLTSGGFRISGSKRSCRGTARIATIGKTTHLRIGAPASSSDEFAIHCIQALERRRGSRACRVVCPGPMPLHHPAASAPRVGLSAAPRRPAGVTRIELAEVGGNPSTTVWPRAFSAPTRSGENPRSTTTSSGHHW